MFTRLVSYNELKLLSREDENEHKRTLFLYGAVIFSSKYPVYHCFYFNHLAKYEEGRFISE